jgi:uncharacterized membrane protein
MSLEVRDIARTVARPSRALVRHVLSLFLTGLLFVLPLILTLVALAWLLGQLGALFGPDTVLGSLIVGLGGLVTMGMAGKMTAFWLGLLIIVGAITGLGALIQMGAKNILEGWVDGLLSRLPVVGKLYQPLAQLVRTVGGDTKGEMASMTVVAVRFGGQTEVLALLASPERFDVGNGPARLILVPTAPVPVGGALLFVAEADVRVVPGVRFDDLAKFYITMGTVAHPALRAAAAEAGPGPG